MPLSLALSFSHAHTERGGVSGERGGSGQFVSNHSKYKLVRVCVKTYDVIVSGQKRREKKDNRNAKSPREKMTELWPRERGTKSQRDRENEVLPDGFIVQPQIGPATTQNRRGGMALALKNN